MSPQWRRPELPYGPLRELNEALHALHARAGHPSSQRIAEWIKTWYARGPARLGRPPSHTRVHQTLTQPAVPNRPVMLDVVEALASAADVDPGPTRERFSALWQRAYDGEERRAYADRVGTDLARTDLPAHVPHRDLLARDGWPRPGSVPIGLDQDGIPAYLDFARDPHFAVLADGRSGKTNLLRLVLHGIGRAYGPADAVVILVDYRRGLAGVLPDAHVLAHVSDPGELRSTVAETRGALLRRTPDGTGRAWTGPRLFLVVDDYDPVARTVGSPLRDLADLVPVGAAIGLHVVIARRFQGAAQAAADDPFLAALIGPNGSGFVGNGDVGDGEVFGGALPAPLPPGRGYLVDRGRAERWVQVAEYDATAPVALAPAPQPQPAPTREHGPDVKGFGRELVALLPPDWTTVDVECRSVGEHVEASGQFTGPDGRAHTLPITPDLLARFRTMRAEMHKPGIGTWTRARYHVTAPGDFTADFDRDEEPDWTTPPPSLAYADELRVYPATPENTPQWLVRGLYG